MTVNCAAPCTESIWLTAQEPGCGETSPRVQVDAILTVAGATTNWTAGAGDTDWFDNLNWDDCVPSCGQNANVPAGQAFYPDVKFSEGILVTTDGIARAQDLTIGAGASVTFGESKSVMEICGDWNQNATGVLTMPMGKLSFVGTSDQTYSNNNTTVANGDIFNLEINNTTGSKTEVTIASAGADMVINSGGSLNLVNGVLVAPAGRKVINNNNTAGSVSVGHTSSWIFGNLEQSVTNVSGNYNFPVGNAVSYQLFYLNNLSNISGGMTSIVGNFATMATNIAGLPLVEGAANFVDLLNNGGPAVGTGSTGNMGVWTVTPNTGGADYNLGLVARNYDNQDIEQTVVKRDDGSSSWSFGGSTYAGTTISGTNSIATYRTGYTGFSQFAVAKSATVLSIELESFTAECVSNGVSINWTTSSETDNMQFIVEKSKDGNEFIQVCSVGGAGASQEKLSYECMDRSDRNGLYFYRLKQIDIDGKSTYSDLISVNCGHLGNKGGNVNVYPNPAVTGSSVYLEFTGISDDKVQLELYDIIGKVIDTYSIDILDSDYYVTTIQPSEDLPEGTYLLQGKYGENVFRKKLVIR